MQSTSFLLWAAAHILDALDIDCDSSTLTFLLGLDEHAAPALKKELLRCGLAQENLEGRLRRSGTFNTLSDKNPPDDESYAPAPLPEALRHYAQGRLGDFLHTGLACLRLCICADKMLEARCAYAVLACLIRKARLPLGQREICTEFVNLALEIQQEMQHFPWSIRDSDVMCYKLRALAFHVGDARSLGLIDLAIGGLNISMRSLRKSALYHKVMLRGIDTVNSIGDSDILIQSSGMICFYYFVEGKFTKAINCAYSAMYMPKDGHNFNFERMLYSYAALSAINLGEYDVAINILHLAINKVEKRETWMDVGSLRAILAHACLMRKDYDEAFLLVDDILGMKRRAVHSYADVLASRSLAYYHYRRGQIRASYVCLKNWQQHAGDRGMAHNNYIAAPFVLELLAAYDEAGFPPLERPLKEELDLCMASPSPLLRGVALRIAASIRTRDYGQHDTQAMALALEGLALVRSCAASVEIAKTQIMLARLHLAKNDRERAGEAADEAWAIHSHCGQPPWPDEMNALRDAQNPACQDGLSVPALCAELFQAVRQQCAWETDEAFFHSLLYALLATLGGEKGLIYHKENHSMRLLAEVGWGNSAPDNAARQSWERKAEEAWASGHTTLYSACSHNLPPCTESTSPEEKTMALAFVADAEEQGCYLLCLEGRPRSRAAQALGKDLFMVLEHYLATEISIHLRRSSAWADRMRSATARGISTGGLSNAGALLFQSDCMRDLLRHADRVAGKDTTVLILGESGVGKELIARRLHEHSGRTGQFVAVNLASTPDELFESEFYGHEKGSFTGANYQKQGLFELADKGTLFIDEAGDIPPRLQVKLLRVLQEKRFLRVGGTRTLTSDFRLVAATNRNLEDEVRAGRFREDLYYRLSVMPLQVPPLRERPEDIAFLADYFLHFFAERHQLPTRPFSEAQRDALMAYTWPGNVRELKNYVERCTLLPAEERPLPTGMQPSTPIQPANDTTPAPKPITLTTELFAPLPSLDELQDQYFEYVYRQRMGAVGGKRGVATVLGMSRTTAYAWIERLKLRKRLNLRLVEQKDNDD